MQTIILLADFDHWFRQLPLRLPGVSRQPFEKLRGDVIDCLSTIAVVKPQSLSMLRNLAGSRLEPEEYIMTLDGSIYFHRPDYSFAMTRAVTRCSDAVRGRMIRVAREGFGQFWTQVAILRREYEASGKKSIVLCDDGIDTGYSLAKVVRQLSEQFLDVSRIVVLLNPHNISSIQGVPVEALLPYKDVLWTHERDLFWGSPTGGVSLITKDNVNRLGGVPYSLTTALLSKRLGIIGIEADVATVRKSLLEINHEFWSVLSRAAGRPLRLRDSRRLLWASEAIDGFSDRSLIVDVIEALIDNEPDW